MPSDSITLTSGIVSVNGRPLLRFDNSARAAVWLSAHGWRLVCSEEQTYCFSK